jgi:hypothetical protein
MAEIEPGVYEHYKGDKYEVLFVAKHSETLAEFVVYQALYGEFERFIRPIKMFTENIERDGVVLPRFRFIDKKEH